MKPPKIEITPKNAGDDENGNWSFGIDKIKIDGKEISGVKLVDVHFDIEKFATVKIEMVGEVSLDVVNMIPDVISNKRAEIERNKNALKSCGNCYYFNINGQRASLIGECNYKGRYRGDTVADSDTCSHYKGRYK